MKAIWEESRNFHVHKFYTLYSVTAVFDIMQLLPSYETRYKGEGTVTVPKMNKTVSQRS